MSSTANLRLRRNAAQLTALAGVEREIRAQDSHSRRKYLREFSQAFRNYDSLLDSIGAFVAYIALFLWFRLRKPSSPVPAPELS